MLSGAWRAAALAHEGGELFERGTEAVRGSAVGPSVSDGLLQSDGGMLGRATGSVGLCGLIFIGEE